MKIKQITFFDTSNNYGQILQCFALQKQMELLGHEVELIRYNPTKGNSGVRIPSGLGVITSVFRKISEGRLKEKVLSKRNEKLDRVRDFNGFALGHIKCTKIYSGIDSLKEDPPKADAYICGSDQIWGKSLMEVDNAAWFLDFGDDDVKRIAYAPSIGRNYTEEELKLFKKYLSRFHMISVREESAAQQCQEVGFDAQVVVDPTLLLEAKEYLALASKIKKSEQHYLFAYILNIKKKEDISWSEISRYVVNSNLDVRAVYSSGYFQAREIIPGVDSECATVEEWIACIRDAHCVITTSFHGTVFCILLHKPFIVFSLPDRTRANDRVMTLLNSLGLDKRLYRSSISFEKQMNEPIDWEDVDKRLKLFKSHSMRFLNQALEVKDMGDMRE